MSILADEIRRWPPAIAGCEVGALTGYLSGKLNRRLSYQEVNEALEWLAARELVQREGAQLWLSEPDRRELDLYDALDAQLQSPAMRDGLGVQGQEYVFQKTASGGGRGDGPLTRPDFTLAAIQSWKFDPRRTLEVFSFEVKNRAGATIPAVYESVAHGRFVHYPYLVCPHSNLNESTNEAIRAACVREGVGLIWFDIAVPGDGSFSVAGLRLVEKAQRRSPDPFLVQRYLENRLLPQNSTTLTNYARGTSP